MANDVWVYNGVEFKSGDKVKVVRFEETDAPNGMGEGKVWNNSWEPDMDKAISLEFEINHIDTSGAYFVVAAEYDYNFSPIHYTYPLSVLEKI